MGKVEVKKVNFSGWENCIRISNGKVELTVTTDVGPRIIQYGFKNSSNHLKIFEEQAGESGSDEWKSYGGHRLWHSPEDFVRTYDKDNFECSYTLTENGIRIKSDMDPKVQVEKEMEISLDPESTRVHINHRITNKNAWEIEYSVWALTVMAEGGREIIPQNTTGVFSRPNRTVALWPYAMMNDKRVSWLSEYIFLDQDPKTSNPFKAGFPVNKGWAAYSNFGQLFVKYFDFDEDALYPDYGHCSYETYTNDQILEMETLSPLWNVLPDEFAEHSETWELHDAIPRPVTEDDVKMNILPLINPLK